MLYDVVIVGGGPGGLSAALTLGRARKRVLLCDAGPRRNAAAVHLHNFVTRDGIPPAEFRRIGREQLAPYANVETTEAHVENISGERGAFEVKLSTGDVQARRILLSTGMVDLVPDIEGFRELWGTSIFQCPYCHAWEVQNRAFAFFCHALERIEFALLLRGWTKDVVVLTDGRFVVPSEVSERLTRAGVRLDERRIARLRSVDGRLDRVEFSEGEPLPRDVLFAHPTQRQVALVESLGLTLDPMGFVKVDEMFRETSRPGIYACGDILTPAQGAINAAATGTMAAATLNHFLTAELALSGALA